MKYARACAHARALILSQGITAVSKNGVLGDARKAEASKGEEYMELLAEKIADFIRKQIARAKEGNDLHTLQTAKGGNAERLYKEIKFEVDHAVSWYVKKL
jgi:hypothetical protein